MSRIVGLVLATVLSATAAQAIVGGAEDGGPLARASLMVVTPTGMCSAVVVAPDVVITAAHCVAGAREYRLHFRDEAGQPVLIAPAAKAVHAAYNANAVENRKPSVDLALVRIPEPLPSRFEPATLSATLPGKGASILAGGYGLAREGDPKTAGTFRTASLQTVEPFGPSRILIWMEGMVAGACQGDSGGPVTQGTSILAITSWAKGSGRSSCGRITQGVLLGPQREWIDKILQGWGRMARWD